MTAKLEEIGCDWLTATSTDEEVAGIMADLWSRMLLHYDIGQAWRRKAIWQGYVGTRVEHAFYGVRDDGACIILSGPLAMDQAAEYLTIGARPSRLDLQVTGTLNRAPGLAVEQMFNDAKLFDGNGHRPPRLKMFVGRKGVEGLYVGARSSLVMLRIYDKGLESGKRAYAGCLRIEAELKHEAAQSAASGWLAHEYDPEHIVGLLDSLVRQRGMHYPFPPASYDVNLRVTKAVTTIEAKAAWLRQQVSPTIMAMAEEIGVARVLSLLLPDSLDKQQDDGRVC